jgi:tetratricopeptide (TPR) repeat protein
MSMAARMNPNDYVMQMRLARAYETAGDRALMETSFRESIRSNPHNLESQNLLARLLLESGRYDEAYMHYKQMFESINPNAEALMNFGALCKQFNRHDEAMTSFEGVLHKFPNYAPAHLLLAEMLDADGKSFDALSHYERYVALEPAGDSQKATARIQQLKARLH